MSSFRQFYFDGGGWCYDEKDCFARSSTTLGSSNDWPSTEAVGNLALGLMNPSCAKNPHFCNFNRVYLKYCDGTSFSGNRDDAVVVDGKPVFFKGHRILNAILNDLAQNHNLGNAENVMLAGESAGGLAVYLHADYVHDRLAKDIAPATLKKYKAVPSGGFFLQHENLKNEPIYPTEMKYLFEMANSTHVNVALSFSARSSHTHLHIYAHTLHFVF